MNQIQIDHYIAVIFYSTMKLIADKGLSNVKIRDIIQDTGINPNLIYKIFPNKEEIILRLFEKCIENLGKRFDGKYNCNTKEYIREKITTIINRDRIYSVIYNEIRAKTLRSPRIEEAFKRLNQSLRTRLELILTNGKNMGHIPKNISTETATDRIIFIIEIARTMTVSETEKPLFSNMISTLIDQSLSPNVEWK
ncbi:TetR/AcrR family transcriptional regulator [Nitrospirillum amazonense]|uniref:TetR/AcrR family transcriptional regulator n=1 Tax=Nitrospirillum amazonense TaxID=28077 RepID=UPI0011A616CE|nr:TetR/AcrR family transcriptional regulator [Nitrospirillum amazonense]